MSGPFPEEIEKLIAIYEPYMVGCHLENAPQEAVEAYDKVKKWVWENWRQPWYKKIRNRWPHPKGVRYRFLIRYLNYIISNIKKNQQENINNQDVQK